MKNTTTILSLVWLAICFAACSDDDGCDNDCPTGSIQLVDCSCQEIGSGSDTCEIEVSSNITSDQTWTAGCDYILSGLITVESGATLTIEPGVVVKAQTGLDLNATSLLVARDATLMAVGTAQAPIIFTSVADNLTSDMVLEGIYASPNIQANVRGIWGGVIILGNAPISVQGDGEEAQIEGISDSDPNGRYGGSDPSDSSGVISYVSIRHGGTVIGVDNEVNGLTLGGVGSGTTIDNVEVLGFADDGIEWFGGTVDVNNALVWSCGDDAMDTDQGWSGTCDNWIVAMAAGGSALELDGPEGTQSSGCSTFIHGSIYGGDNIDHLIDWDEDTNTGITNLYIFGIDSEFNPAKGFENFGGDGSCMISEWEYSLPEGYDPSILFAEIPAAAEVSIGQNTTGADGSVFPWTYAADSGTLSSIGL